MKRLTVFWALLACLLLAAPAMAVETTATGKVVATVTRDVRLPFNAVIDEVLVRPGDAIKAGDPLVRYHLQDEAERVLQREVTTGAATESLRGQILDRAVIIAQLAKQRAGGQKRIEQESELLSAVLFPALKIAVVAEGDDGLLRQIRGGGREFRVNQRHVSVSAGEKRLVFKRLAVLLQCFDQRLIGRFPALLARDDRAQVLAQPRRALRVQMRLRLRHGQEDGLFHVFRAPLGDGVKIAHGVQLVAEKLRAQRLFLRRRIHVQNAAAQRELSHALDQTCTGIARPGQAADEIRHAVFCADPERH